MLTVATALGAFTVFPEKASAYTLSDPILIEGNADFSKPQSGVTDGSGTVDDPYIIEGWQIDCDSAVGIAIYNTTDYFIIRDVVLYSEAGVYCLGVELRNVLNGALENSSLTSIHTNIVLEDCVDVRLANSTVDSYGNGIVCTNCTRVTISDCVLNLSHPLYLFDSDGIVLSGNTIDRAWCAGTVEGCVDISILNNSITYSQWDSIQFTECANITISGNDLWNNGYSGVTLQSCVNTTICSNNFTGSGYGQGTGVRMFGVHDSYIYDNVFSDHGIAFVSGTGCTNITVDWCEATCQMPFTAGMSFSDSENVSITNVNITGSSDGIAVSDCEQVVVSYNTLATNRTNGIDIRSTNNTMVVGNEVAGPWNYAIYLDSVPHSFVESNEVGSAGFGGILLIRSNDPNTGTQVESNVICDAQYGITASMADSTNVVAHNTISACGDAGIYLAESVMVDVHENDVSGCGLGILVSASSASMSSNILTENSGGFRLEDAYECLLVDNTFQGGGVTMTGTDVYNFASHFANESNTVNGLPLVYRAGGQLLDLTGIKAGQLILANCSIVTVANSNISQTDVAMQLYFCGQVTIRDCGISMNSECGIVAGYSTDVEITENNLSENEQAIDLTMSERVRIYHNNFFDSTPFVQVWDNNLHMNDWDDGYPSGGNFWSDLVAPDTKSGPDQDINGSDAISDIPYSIGIVDFDMYPLMIPWGEPQPPIAVLTWYPELPIPGEAVDFNASGSGDRDGTIISYEWEFGDGNEDYSTEPFAHNTYVLEGNYTVNLTVTDDNGMTHLLSLVLTVMPGPDEEPPTTSLSLAGIEGDNGWYASTVEITLTSEADDLNGTVYRLDGGEWTDYWTPIMLDDDGVYFLEYYSVDTSGNIEDVRTAEIMIDSELPEISMGAEPVLVVGDTANITWSCLDTLSGVAYVEYSLDDGTFVQCSGVGHVEIADLSDGEHTVIIVVYDHAGNSANVSVTFSIDTAQTSSPYLLPIGLAVIGAVAVLVLAMLVLSRRNLRKPPET